MSGRGAVPAERIREKARLLESQNQQLRAEIAQLQDDQLRVEELCKAGISKKATFYEQGVRVLAQDAVRQEKAAHAAAHEAATAQRSAEVAERECAGRQEKAVLLANRAEERLVEAQRSFDGWQRQANAATLDKERGHAEAVDQASQALAQAEADAERRTHGLRRELAALKARAEEALELERIKVERIREATRRREAKEQRVQALRLQEAQRAVQLAEEKRDRQLEAARRRVERSKQAAASKASLGAHAQHELSQRATLRLEQAEEETRLRGEMAAQRESAAMEDLDAREATAERRAAAAERVFEAVRQECAEVRQEQQARLEKFKKELAARAVVRQRHVQELKALSTQRTETVQGLGERLKEEHAAEVAKAFLSADAERSLARARVKEHEQLLSKYLAKQRQHALGVHRHAEQRLREVDGLLQRQDAKVDTMLKSMRTQAEEEVAQAKAVVEARAQQGVEHLMNFLDPGKPQVNNPWAYGGIADTTMPLPGGIDS